MTAGRFDKFEDALGHRHGGRADHHPDNGRIAPRYEGIHHGRMVVSSRLSSTCTALTCWFLELTGGSASQAASPVFSPCWCPKPQLVGDPYRGTAESVNAEGCTARERI
jgi:hypothetical protein